MPNSAGPGKCSRKNKIGKSEAAYMLLYLDVESQQETPDFYIMYRKVSHTCVAFYAPV